jgi:hypothetical protein
MDFHQCAVHHLGCDCYRTLYGCVFRLTAMANGAIRVATGQFITTITVNFQSGWGLHVMRQRHHAVSYTAYDLLKPLLWILLELPCALLHSMLMTGNPSCCSGVALQRGTSSVSTEPVVQGGGFISWPWAKGMCPVVQQSMACQFW